ncbi:MAG: MBL fold metallo-hydrolase [Myxococcota bacterium]
MKSEVLFERPGHKWVIMGRDPDRRDEIVDTNELAVITDSGTLLMDPGGIEIFPKVLSELTRYVSPDEVEVLFASHQDPDIISSLPMWLDLCPKVKTYVSWLWCPFVSHFATGRNATIIGVPDEGQTISVGASLKVQAIPAHYCHSSGNFSLFDPEARILFSGDIGSAFLSSADAGLFVEDFESHAEQMRSFHSRWMPSHAALNTWTQRVRALEPKMIAPHHGRIFKDDQVWRLLDWLDGLDVGQLFAV